MKNIYARLLMTIAMAWLLSFTARAQYMMGNKEVDTTFNHQMNLAFGLLELNRVPYGILRDYAMEFTSLAAYDGTYLADSNRLNKRIFYEIYNTLVTARVHASAYASMPDPAYTDSLWFTKRQPGG
jgi:predicted nucleic acid-binding protein